MTNARSRVDLRRAWNGTEHFQALDADVDELEDSLVEIRSTLRWILTTLVGIFCAIIAGLVTVLAGRL